MGPKQQTISQLKEDARLMHAALYNKDTPVRYIADCLLSFPTIEEMEAHDTRRRVREFLPALIYYIAKDEDGEYLYDSDDPDLESTRLYIEKLAELYEKENS